MFEERSDVKSMFEQFRTVEKQDLGTSQSLENHALLVMNALDEAIANMDDPEYLIEMLLTTGKSHRRFDDFVPDSFWAIEEPFIQATRESLGDRFTNHMDGIYRKTIRFVLEVLIFGLKNNFEESNTENALPAFGSQR
ncbi:hypothetical protein CAPTEDRAFT_147415 [Capitella teleta]|uniref:Globin domain-containing protein n=1 Tax=Capitella teleta TaxID=283909 RepID=R7THE1_CAPTE|nr:hypothetical protein CAPTEDRAFT_147415 [Capitella teleta]|eukprot:ELT93223.1 hypothetical protein CAPTEDRAFT_147415 [Capitella teleta]